MSTTKTAPDGQPWPAGYFDVKPKETFEEALAAYGVRPNHYRRGRPVYTQSERDNPAYICTIPAESPADEALWKAQWEGATRREMDLRGATARANWAPFEVRLVKIRDGKAILYRPCLVVECFPDTLEAGVFLLATRDVSKNGDAFKMDASSPDFAATGLRQTSYTVSPMQIVTQD